MEARDFDPRSSDAEDLAPRLRELARVRDGDWVAEASATDGTLLVACATGPPTRELRELARALRAALVASSGDAATATGRPRSIDRVVGTLRAAHHLIARARDLEAGHGIAVLVAQVAAGRVHVVHAGGQLRLMRLTGDGTSEPIAGPLPQSAPTLIGSDARVRIEVASAPLRAGELLYALPVEVEPDGAEEALLASLTRWSSIAEGGEPSGAMLDRARGSLTFAPEALPQAFACLLATPRPEPGADESAAPPPLPPPVPVERVEPVDRDTAALDAWDGLMQAARDAVRDIARHAAAEVSRATAAGVSDATPAPREEPLDTVEEHPASGFETRTGGEWPQSATGDEPLPAMADEPSSPMADEPLPAMADKPSSPMADGPLPAARWTFDELDDGGAELHENEAPRSEQPRAGAVPTDDELPDFLSLDAMVIEPPACDPPCTSDDAPREVPTGADRPDARDRGIVHGAGWTDEGDVAAAGDGLPVILPFPVMEVAAAPETAPEEDAVDSDRATVDDEELDEVAWTTRATVREHHAGEAPPTTDLLAPRDLDDDAPAVAVHPWIARRQGRHAGGRGRWWLVIGVASALAGALGVLALTGGLERLLPDVPSLGSLLGGRGAARTTVPLDAPVIFPLRSRPAGAELLVDGQATGRLTPVQDLELVPGTHRVELRLAGLGTWSGEVAVPAGVTEAAGVELVLAGSLSAVTDKTAGEVIVHLDDQPLGPAPVHRDGIVAGRHVVRFIGPGSYVWDEEIVVRIDETAEVVARMDGVEDFGLITVRSYGVGPTGKFFVDGDRVTVDGKAQGTTPTEIFLPAGRHVIDVARQGHGAVKQVVAVQGGDRRFVDLRLDRLPALRIEHQPAARFEVDSTPLVSVSLAGQGADRHRKVYMHVELDETWQRVRMAAVPGAAATYVVAMPVTSVHAGETVRYYFTSEDPAGQATETEIYAVPLE